MIRPCDQCGGSGVYNALDEYPKCERCEGMPKLPRKVSAGESLLYGYVRDWFYPDPDSEGLAYYCVEWRRISDVPCDKTVIREREELATGHRGCGWVLVTPLVEAT